MTFRIERGGGYRPRTCGREARRKVEREMHAVALKVTPVPDKSFYDLRRQKTKPLGALLWFLDRAHAVGTPMSVLLTIPQWLEWYIRDLFASDQRAA
jgi:hypothetical protein